MLCKKTSLLWLLREASLHLLESPRNWQPGIRLLGGSYARIGLRTAVLLEVRKTELEVRKALHIESSG